MHEHPRAFLDHRGPRQRADLGQTAADAGWDYAGDVVLAEEEFGYDAVYFGERSKAAAIESRSFWRKKGLISGSKLSLSPAPAAVMALPLLVGAGRRPGSASGR